MAGMQKPTARLRRGLLSICHAFCCLSPARALWILYFFFCLVRILLAIFTTKTPVIMPDSALYLNLGTSIFTKGALLLRGQPIRYEYILYPLLLAPLGLLPDGASIFRGIQVLNALVMHLAVFPAYALGRAVAKSHKRALAVALLTLMMPDFLMVEHIMAESLAFPLILTACCAFYARYGLPPRHGTSLLWGGLGFLLYTVKPGYVALPACFIFLLLFEAIRLRSKPRLFQALESALAFFLLLGLYLLLLRFGLHLSPGQSTLYGSQTHPLTWDHLLQSLNGLLLYGAWIPVAFLFFPLYLPAAHLKAFEQSDRRLLQTVLLSLLALVAGTVYVIYYDEVLGGDPYSARIHVRYGSALLPVLMAFLLSPTLAGKRMNGRLFSLLAFSLASMLLLGGLALVSGRNFPVDALLLSVATLDTEGLRGRLIWLLAAAVFLLVMAYRLARGGYGRPECRALCLSMLLAFLVNGAVGVSLNSHHNDSLLPGEAREAVARTGAGNVLGVVRDGAYFWPEAGELDVASRCRLPVVELDDLIANTGADGTLSAFVPAAYWQENPENEIPVPEKLILSGDILNDILLSEEAGAGAAATSNAGYVTVDLPAQTPWIHSGLSGLSEGWVQPGSRFTVFDGALRAKGAISLQLLAKAGEGQANLILAYGSQEQRFPLSEELTWIAANFTVESPEKALTVTLENSGGDVYVKTYLVE